MWKLYITQTLSKLSLIEAKLSSMYGIRVGYSCSTSIGPVHSTVKLSSMRHTGRFIPARPQMSALRRFVALRMIPWSSRLSGE